MARRDKFFDAENFAAFPVADPDASMYLFGMVKASDIYGSLVSTRALTQLTGSDARTIGDIFRAAGLSPAAHDRNTQLYVLGDALRTIVSFRRRVDTQVDVEGELLTLEEAKTRDLVAAAKAKEWKLERDKGLHIPREQVKQDFDALARVVMAWLDGLPAIVTEAMRAEMRRELERGIRSLAGAEA